MRWWTPLHVQMLNWLKVSRKLSVFVFLFVESPTASHGTSRKAHHRRRSDTNDGFLFGERVTSSNKKEHCRLRKSTTRQHCAFSCRSCKLVSWIDPGNLLLRYWIDFSFVGMECGLIVLSFSLSFLYLSWSRPRLFGLLRPIHQPYHLPDTSLEMRPDLLYTKGACMLTIPSWLPKLQQTLTGFRYAHVFSFSTRFNCFRCWFVRWFTYLRTYVSVNLWVCANLNENRILQPIERKQTGVFDCKCNDLCPPAVTVLSPFQPPTHPPTHPPQTTVHIAISSPRFVRPEF